MGFVTTSFIRLGELRPNATYMSRMCTKSECNGVGATADVRKRRAALWREVDSLRRSMEHAVTAERYIDAARLRDEIEELTLRDEWIRARRKLDSALEQERYADAAHWRDTLAKLEPPPSISDAKDKEKARSTFSETTTHGITVQVESYYMPEQSKPPFGYLFGYKVKIINNSIHTVQLVSRRWTISSNGNIDHNVSGPGVVGRQPVLQPGDTFSYRSACPLKTNAVVEPGVFIGSMHGEYDFCRGSIGDIRFKVRVDPFYFQIPPLLGMS